MLNSDGSCLEAALMHYVERFGILPEVRDLLIGYTPAELSEIHDSRPSVKRDSRSEPL